MISTDSSPAEPLDTVQQWDNALLRDPHHVADKRTRAHRMFSAIAASYDLNNRLHSLWMDQAWRRRAVKLAGLAANDDVVDVACGTGDLTLAFYEALLWKKLHRERLNLVSPHPAQVIGIDFTYEMLPRARF